MTQEEKRLLLKDLCARLPYGVVVSKKPINESFTWQELQGFQYGKIYKPYLRPMSSMTEKEKKSYHNYKYWIGKGDIEYCTINMMDWLNANHFDYRGLIEKGLALEAPEGMYETKQTMGYCLRIIKKDGSVSNHYFSSYEDLDYNATFCEFSTNITKAIGLKIGLFKDKILFEIG